MTHDVGARGLPAVAAVGRPTAAVAVVFVHRAVFAGVNVVLARSNPSPGIRVVGESTAPGRSLAAVDVPHVTGSAARHDPSVRVVGCTTTITSGVAGVDVGVCPATCNCGPAGLL